MFLVQEGEDMGNWLTKGQEGEEISVDTEKADEAKVAALSLHSLAGFDSLKTLKIKGEIQGKEVVILIDGGGNPQFYFREVGDRVKLAVTMSKEYGVVLGTGGTVRTAGGSRHTINNHRVSNYTRISSITVGQR